MAPPLRKTSGRLVGKKKPNLNYSSRRIKRRLEPITVSIFLNSDDEDDTSNAIDGNLDGLEVSQKNEEENESNSTSDKAVSKSSSEDNDVNALSLSVTAAPTISLIVPSTKNLMAATSDKPTPKANANKLTVKREAKNRLDAALIKNEGQFAKASSMLDSSNASLQSLEEKMLSSHEAAKEARNFQTALQTEELELHPLISLNFIVAFLALASSFASTYDPSPLQDFSVAVNDSKSVGIFLNGKFCKDPNLVVVEDFFKHVDAGNTSNKLGSKVTPVSVNELFGLNTLSISLARIDFAAKGLNPPHIHLRGTEILIVIEGTLYIGFVSSNKNNGQNRLFTEVLNKGDVFVFPKGLAHFQLNVGYENTVAVAALSSQNAGVITIANAVFGSTPPISDQVLAKAFQVDKNTVDYLQKI
ncbi:germin-like protein subfamily 1 member 17 [Arachis ipaensis]|uniref:germin-like protein subfamily 1 member 17 n=1 Tax=Arachis ipaensis TaxID=130454 RepID=UPI0007AF631A|nr:germin-like protein subfamily 1 member 17 [Arachis ipaensis]XP_025640580.1 germin-like protein subfamily 1 member 17 [Arachis hypogaea]